MQYTTADGIDRIINLMILLVVLDFGLSLIIFILTGFVSLISIGYNGKGNF